MNKTALVILALAFASSAYGMVFSWTDASGIKHYSNRRDEIPERYRARAKPLYPEQADLLPGQQGTQPPPVKSEIMPAAPVVVPVIVPPAVQQTKPQEPPKTGQPVVVPEPPKNESAPVTTRKVRRTRPASSRDEE